MCPGSAGHEASHLDRPSNDCKSCQVGNYCWCHPCQELASSENKLNVARTIANIPYAVSGIPRHSLANRKRVSLRCRAYHRYRTFQWLPSSSRPNNGCKTILVLRCRTSSRKFQPRRLRLLKEFVMA